MSVASALAAGAGGAAFGAVAPVLASLVAEPRYGPAAPDHDPEDAALAPLPSLAGPRVRTGSAAVGALAGAAIGVTDFRPAALLVLLGTAALLLVLCLVDLQYLRLPNLLTYGGAAAAFVGVSLASVALDVAESIRGAVIGGLGYALFLFLVATAFRVVTGRDGMGLGDVKLALLLGATAGWLGYFADTAVGPVQYVIYAAFAGNVLGAVGGVALGRGLGKHFPFGPFLALGWLAVVALTP